MALALYGLWAHDNGAPVILVHVGTQAGCVRARDERKACPLWLDWAVVRESAPRPVVDPVSGLFPLGA